MPESKANNLSLFSYLRSEVTRGYHLEQDEARYKTKREKMYTFMKIPRELEKFMSYGFFQCLDSFLFVFTFLPVRFGLAIWALIWRWPWIMLGLMKPKHGRLLYPAEIIDLSKGFIVIVGVYAMTYIDTSMMYHIIKSQSVIKLYLFYNMLEVGDRLFSAFGQDTIDALFWTATEPRNRKRETIGVIPHFLLGAIYVFLHALLVLFQATTLNVAVNASNKALLTIMMSNNFVELKGSVFKKFDKNNLFQVSCSDVRERFHLFALLFVVVVQTMKEYGFREESFWSLAPDCLMVLSAEFLVDWIKHAFITRFNEVSAEVYKDYTISLAYDLATTKQKHAFSDHADLVSRKMGFMPLPLGVVMIRVIGSAIKLNGFSASMVIFGMAYLCLVTFRILGSIVILGKACDLIDQHQNYSNLTKQQQPPQSQTNKEEQNVNDGKELNGNKGKKPNINDVLKPNVTTGKGEGSVSNLSAKLSSDEKPKVEAIFPEFPSTTTKRFVLTEELQLSNSNFSPFSVEKNNSTDVVVVKEDKIKIPVVLSSEKVKEEGTGGERGKREEEEEEEEEDRQGIKRGIESVSRENPTAYEKAHCDGAIQVEIVTTKVNSLSEENKEQKEEEIAEEIPLTPTGVPEGQQKREQKEEDGEEEEEVKQKKLDASLNFDVTLRKESSSSSSSSSADLNLVLPNSPASSVTSRTSTDLKEPPVSPSSSSMTSSSFMPRPPQRSLSTPDILNESKGEKYWPSVSSDDDEDDNADNDDEVITVETSLNSSSPNLSLRRRLLSGNYEAFIKTKDGN